MLDHEPTGGDRTGAEPATNAADSSTTPARRPRRRPTKAAPETVAGDTTAAARAGRAGPAPSTAASKPSAGPAGDAAAEEKPARTLRARKTTKATAPEQLGDSVPAAAETDEGRTKGTRSRRRKAVPEIAPAPPAGVEPEAVAPVGTAGATKRAPAKRTGRAARAPSDEGRPTAESAPTAETAPRAESVPRAETVDRAPAEPAATRPSRRRAAAAPPSTAVIFMAPTEVTPSATGAPAAAPSSEASAGPAPRIADDLEGDTGRTRRRRGRRAAEPAAAPESTQVEVSAADEADEDDELDSAGRRRRRGRRGRGRGKGSFDTDTVEEAAAEAEPAEAEDEDEDEPTTRRRRRRRRRGTGAEGDATTEEGVVTVVKIREPRSARDEVQGVTGSTRLEAKRQRRRDGREQRRTRPPILSESEFLARREAVDRVMVIRQSGTAGRPDDRTQIAVLEDGILVEHYVTRQSASTMVGNVYLGKVQNVLPSMEAAFVDIGRGRNAVLYAGEVNWDVTGLEGKARSIEQALKSGESVLVQVTKDPVGHKGARLTSHIALSGRHLVYVPNGHASGISRKLSDVERRRLRDVLKNMVPDGAGVIVRTAAEGAAEDDLARDVKRLQAQWEDIQSKAADGGAPVLLYGEPDLVIRVVRDLFNEDFREVVIEGEDAYGEVGDYLSHVSPDLVARVRRHAGKADVFAEYRIDEQILKGLDRKVYLPSGGHLVIDRTEAMTVIDVNTGKYTGAGGNLEETVTRNNLEAAEEIVRQLRLRDLGGIIVIDFIDMVLESNRELVLRRLTECLGRDRTKHQVTEITSLGLVQMTRKRIGQGLLEAFSEPCDHCKGRGVLIHTEPVSEKPRNAVAERVKAVAASSRGETTPPDESAAPDEAESALSAGGEADGQYGPGDEAEPSEIVELSTDDLDADAATPARRRARRSGTRRRTRP